MTEEIIKMFYEIYQPHQYEVVYGYEGENNKQIVVFQNIKTRRCIHVYKNNKGFLRPYFDKEKLIVIT